MVSLFSSVAPLPSGLGVNTLPCQAHVFAKRARIRAQTVPEQAIAMPVESPLGIGPGRLCLNRSSNSARDNFSRSDNLVMVFPLGGTAALSIALVVDPNSVISD